MTASRILLLDTVIVSQAAKRQKHPELSDSLATYLQLLSKNYELSISGICRYELFQASTLETAQRVKKFTDYLRTFDVDNNVINVAATLSTCYENHPTIKGRHGSISIPDRIIGATSILQNCHILTCDFNDFPRPFFVEHSTGVIKYQKSSKNRFLDVYILKPDIAAYKRSFTACYVEGV